MNIQSKLLMISSIGFSEKLPCIVDKSDLGGRDEWQNEIFSNEKGST